MCVSSTEWRSVVLLKFHNHLSREICVICDHCLCQALVGSCWLNLLCNDSVSDLQGPFMIHTISPMLRGPIRHSVSVLCVRWTRGRWWLAFPVGCWGWGRQSIAQTWWHPKRDSSSSGRQRWKQWQKGALGRATRWRKRGHWSWQSQAGPSRSGCTRAMAPADCGQRGKTSFDRCDLMIPFWFIF